MWVLRLMHALSGLACTTLISGHVSVDSPFDFGPSLFFFFMIPFCAFLQ